MERPSFEFLKQIPFWLLAAAVLVVLVVPVLIQDGMFMDGQQYAIVAKNLAEGRGTFWHPHLSDTWTRGGGHFFLEHPPLVYGIQAVFFRLLGDSMYIERFYSFLTAIITAWLIVVLWRSLHRSLPGLRVLGWLPVLLWIIVPVCYWSYQNNMLENTMGIFTLASVVLSYKALKHGKQKFLQLALSGFCIFLASLSKGLPGLFPLAVPAIYWILHQGRLLNAIGYTLLLLLIPVVCYGLLLLYPPAFDSLSFYAGHRLISRITDEPTVSDHFFIVKQLFMELLPVIILCVLFLIVFRIKKINNWIDTEYRNDMLLFLLMGLAGSLPVMLTPVQKAFYVVASFPFFGIGFAMLIAPGLQHLIDRWKMEDRFYLGFQAFAVVALSGAITFSVWQMGKVGRHKEILHDVYVIGPQIPESATISVQPELYLEWSLQFYLLRHYNISMDGSGMQRKYFLVEKGKEPAEQQLYQKLPLETEKYDLYEKVE